MAFEQRLGEVDDVLAALPQRRNRQRHRVEVLNQLFPELSVRHQGLDPAMRRRYDPDIGRMRSRTTKEVDEAVLCGGGGNSPDFLQKQGASIGGLQEPGHRARWRVPWPKSSDSMRACGVAAQLRDIRGACRRRPDACNARATSSLPVPGFTFDQDGRLGGRHHLYPLKQFPHGGGRNLAVATYRISGGCEASSAPCEVTHSSDASSSPGSKSRGR